jgi:hypothetical protein
MAEALPFPASPPVARAALEVAAPPKPWIKRAAIRPPSAWELAPMTAPTMQITKPRSMVFFLPIISEMGPTSKWPIIIP